LDNMPQVSVFLASYNHARYIGKTLDSVLAQTFRDIEIVVVDDGSTDGSHEILLDYQQRYPDTIRYFTHPGRANKGVSITSNVGIEKSRGEYLAWLGSDDIWLPEKLAKQVDYLAHHLEAGMVYSLAYVIDENDNQYPGVAGKALGRPALNQLILANDLPASSVMVRRSCLDDVGVFDEKLIYSDWDLWIRIAAKYEIGCTAEPLVMYRVHGRNMSVSGQPEIKLKRNLQVIEAAVAHVPGVNKSLIDQATAHAHFGAALDYFAAGQSDEAQQHITEVKRLLHTPLPLPPDELTEFVVAYAMHSLPVSHRDTEGRVHFLKRVFSNLAPDLESKAIAKLYITDAFRSHSQGDAPLTRQNIVRAMRLDASWLRNKGVLSIGADAFLGQNVAHQLRRLARPRNPQVRQR
jgi:hypothetical protein